MADAINPSHYSQGNDVQLIELVRLMPFSLGNAVKYCYRNGHKESALQDLRKAKWYLNDHEGHVLLMPVSSEAVADMARACFSTLSPEDSRLCYALVRYYITQLEANEQGRDIIEDSARDLRQARQALDDRIASLESGE